MHDLEARVLAWTGNRLERLIFTPEGLQQAETRGEPVVTSLRQEAVLLYGMGVDAVLDRRLIGPRSKR